ncbi:hypothetical protein OH807_30765 [Kitasatospora sp. NBC_01560]|uniref:hypothetical protein n=1 Tax=Kitasatospora sp. NBC_01560 TaxID=2975965 RepID=UPI00386830F7
MSANLPERLAALFDQAQPVPTPFVLRRDTDVSGVSGTGTVAEGCFFSAAAGSTAVTRWRGERGSTVAWDRAQDVEAVHGHGGATRVIALPLPAMVSALTSIASLGEQRVGDQWADGWNQALEAVRGLIEAALGPHLDSGSAASPTRESRPGHA